MNKKKRMIAVITISHISNSTPNHGDTTDYTHED